MNFEPLSDHLIANLMRANGTTPPSPQTPLTAMRDFLKTPIPPIPPPAHHPTLVIQNAALPLSEIPTQPLTWLWPERIPQGKLTLLDGESGSGTSLLALTLAACISSGQPLPASTSDPTDDPAPNSTTTGNVVLIAPYDHAGDTIKPRLQAAGSDPSRIFLLNSVPTVSATPAAPLVYRPFCLADDLPLLEATIKRLQAVLVIIDPLQAVLAPSRSRSSSSSRPSTHTLLASLTHLAQRTNCAFLLVRPVRPSRSDPRRMPPGSSLDQISLARAGLLVTRDPEDEHTRLLLPTKHSLCQQPPILSYEIVEHPCGVPIIHWLGPWQGSSSSLLDAGHTFSAQRQAILDFLQQYHSPATARTIAIATGYNYECVRKMLQRMTQQADLVSPARGLYTTTAHPSLAKPSTDLEPTPPQLDVPNVAPILNGESSPSSTPIATNEESSFNLAPMDVILSATKDLPSPIEPPNLTPAPIKDSSPNDAPTTNPIPPTLHVANVPTPETSQG